MNIVLACRILSVLDEVLDVVLADGVTFEDLIPLGASLDGQPLEMALRRPYPDRPDLNPDAWWMCWQAVLCLLRSRDRDPWRRAVGALRELVQRDLGILRAEIAAGGGGACAS